MREIDKRIHLALADEHHDRGERLMEWNVYLEYAGEVDEDALFDALESLESHSPSASIGDDRFGVRLFMSASDPATAIQKAETKVARSLRSKKLSGYVLQKVEALTIEALASEAQVTNFPRLVGVAEVAQMLDVTKQRVSQLMEGSRFPRPAAVLASTPVWLEQSIRAFASSWDRKPGRPASKAPSVKRGRTQRSTNSPKAPRSRRRTRQGPR